MFGRVVVTAEVSSRDTPGQFRCSWATMVFIIQSPVMLARAPLGHVTFEGGCIDPAAYEGWDVVVTGDGDDTTGSPGPAALAARSYLIKSLGPGTQSALDLYAQPAFHRAQVPAPKYF